MMMNPFGDLRTLWPMKAHQEFYESSHLELDNFAFYNQNQLFDYVIDSFECNSTETTNFTPSITSKSTSPISFEHEECLVANIEKNITEFQSHKVPRLRKPSAHVSSRVNTYCETVAVESSGHVAQIVGKNGCKIKHLRAKYGTYIHTPSTNDEPVFIIKGQRDKVLAVKQEIIKADNHFSNIKEARNTKIAKMINSQDAACIRLFIPSKYIGLVVGRNGWFVKDLQSKYNIYIETPKFDLCNYFQLYGLRERVIIVKQLIYEHIYKKTGIAFREKHDFDDIYFIE